MLMKRQIDPNVKPSSLNIQTQAKQTIQIGCGYMHPSTILQF